MTVEAPLRPAWPLPERIVQADGLLVGVDFDGTLAPIAADPDEPRITAACRRALGRLVARDDTLVAVVSGRALTDLRPRVWIEGVVYAGNHGLELAGPTGRVVHRDAARLRPVMTRLGRALPERLAGIPGWTLEDKALSLTVHVRETPPERVADVRAAMAAAVREARAPLRLVRGKQAIELRPAIGWDKGSVLAALVDRVPVGWRPVYVGDDTSDEPAFRAVRPAGLGVLVGSRQATEATRRLTAQSAVAPFLADLAAARHGATRS